MNDTKDASAQGETASPRTDALVSIHDEATPWVGGTAGYNSLLDFARTLEAELTAAEQRVRELEQTERELRRLIDRGPTVSEYELKLSAQLSEQRDGSIKLLAEVARLTTANAELNNSVMALGQQGTAKNAQILALTELLKDERERR